MHARRRSSRLPGFWEGLSDIGLQQRIARIAPGSKAVRVDEERLDTIAEAFARGGRRQVAFVAAAHDERLDNKGIRAAARPTASRSKLAPARWPTSSTPSPPSGRTAPIPVTEAIALMEKERDAAIDDDCLDALKQALHEFGF